MNRSVKNPLCFLCPLWLVLCCLLSSAGEKLLKPVPGPGAGQAADGLRAAVAMVKNDFGPGESLLLVWEVFNESGKSIELALDKHNWYDFSFDVRRDGQPVEVPRNSAQHRPDVRAAGTVLETGQSRKFFIDLTALDWSDPKWCAALGNYEVSATYAPLRLRSGWTKFRVTQPGEKHAAPAPEPLPQPQPPRPEPPKPQPPAPKPEPPRPKPPEPPLEF